MPTWKSNDPDHPDLRGVVIVRSPRRPVTEVEVHRPGTMPGKIVIRCNHKATDAQIIDACVGLLSDDEMARVFEYFGITIPPDPEEQPS